MESNKMCEWLQVFQSCVQLRCWGKI